MENCHSCRYLTNHKRESQIWFCRENEEKKPIAINQSDIERIEGTCMFFEGKEEDI